MNSEIVSQTPWWYILLCMGLGIAFAIFFYFRTGIFSKNQKLTLAVVRGLLVFTITYLLLNPLIKTVSSVTLKPKVVVLVDNSKSMAINNRKLAESRKSLSALKKSIEDKGFEIEVKDFGGNVLNEIDSKNFKNKKTNVSSALNSIKNDYEGQNLTDVILFSDGIINDGISPTFSKFPFNIHTIGFGDSTVKKDAFISGISANKLAYLGNDFLVTVDVGSHLLRGKTANVQIKNNDGTLISQKSVVYQNDESFQNVSFEIPAKTVGKQRYIIDLQAVDGEVTLKNNRREFIVDVVNGKEKILLLAYAPHPDLKAIKSILEKNDLFELNIKVVQQSDIQEISKEVYDVLILHQFPDVDNFHTQFLGSLLAKQKPTFFILGSKSNISYFNGMQNIVGINAQLNKIDKVTGQVNPSFSLFNFTDPQASLIASLPPVNVPFGSYTLNGGAEVILGQYVSGINTSRPLLAVNLTGTRKMAAFLAEGLWNWRMEEFAMNDQNQYLDDLIIKTLQLISVKEDKGKLRVYPVSDVFDVDQRVGFVAEVYNEIYERIYNQNIRLKIKPQGDAKERIFDFKVTEESSRFEISNLVAGVYAYEATAKILGKDETVNGQFVVSDSDVELQNTVADFSLLRTLAKENNGDFVNSENIIELRNSLEKRGLVNKIIAQEDLKDLINLRWLLLLILLFATVEWILRKYFGSY